MVGIRPRVLAAANIDQGLDGRIGPSGTAWISHFLIGLLRIPLRTMLLQ
jgi:hypothetical protein